MKVLFVSQEIFPFLPETTMSYTTRYLPQYVQEAGNEIRLFMPRFGNINQRRNQLHEVIRLSGINIIINHADYPLIIKVSSIQTVRMQVYFIDNEEFFQRKFVLEDENGVLFEDTHKRGLFFGKGIIETVRELQWEPTIVHCHGWFSFAVPYLIKRFYNTNPLFADAKIVYSYYNNSFEGELSKELYEILQNEGLDAKECAELENPTFKNINEFIFKHVDGIIQGEESIDNPQMQAKIQQSNKPFFEYQDVNSLEAGSYINFYKKVLEG